MFKLKSTPALLPCTPVRLRTWGISASVLRSIFTSSILSLTLALVLLILPLFSFTRVHNAGTSVRTSTGASLRAGTDTRASVPTSLGSTLRSLFAPATASALASDNLNFQARLQTASGAIVPDGYYNIEFKLYTASSSAGSSQGSCAGDAACVWTETHYDSNGVTAGNDNRIRVVNGYVSVYLGSLTAFPSTIPWDQQLYLTMNVGGSTQTATPTYDGEMTPRLKLTAVPYAMESKRASELATSNGALLSTLSIEAPTVGNQTFVIQDQGAAGTYNLLTAPAGSDGYVKLQTTSPGTQQTGNINISGSILSPTLDTATGVALNIGTTGTPTTTQINLNQDSVLAAGKTIRITGGITSTRPTPTTEGVLYFDTDTNQLLTSFLNADTGIYQWKASGQEAVLVAASDSSDADKAAADYVADGTADQTDINYALAAAASTGSRKSGKVYLFAGTYTTSDSIIMANNVTLAGAGRSTLIKFANLAGASKDMIINSDTTTGEGIVIRDLRIDGNTANAAAGTVQGIYLFRVGSATGLRQGPIITNIYALNFRSNAIRLDNSSNGTITGSNFQSNGTGLYLSSGNRMSVTNNVFLSNSNNGLVLSGALYDTISANNFIANSTIALQITGSSQYNIINANNFYDNTASTANSTIVILSTSKDNVITNNEIIDTAGTGYAINISDSGSTTNYLANNYISGTGATSINDAAVGSTIYAGQLATAGGVYTIQNAGGVAVSSSAGATSNNVTMTTGNASAGAAGNITIDTGTFTSGTPTVSIGAANAAAVIIGNTTAATTTAIYGGTGTSAITLQAGASGVITVGSQTVANTINVGTVGSAAFSSTVNIGTSTGAAQTVNIGSANGTSTTSIYGGSGGIGLTGNTSINTTGTNTTTIGSNTAGAVSITSNAASNFTTNTGLLTLQGQGGVSVLSTAGTTSTAITIATGNASGGASGNISLDTGTATTTTGTISIGTGNASAVSIGKTTTTVTIQGNLTAGNAAGTGTFTNNGATINTEKTYGNFATGGAMDTAANSVDKYTYFSIAQTTASQAITLPAPTTNPTTVFGRLIYISNIGSASFTVNGSIVASGNTVVFIWSNTDGAATTGETWQYAGGGSSSTNFIQNQTAVAQTAGFNISGAGTIGGLLTASAGATINGTVQINTTGTGTTSIGNGSSGTITIGNSATGAISIQSGTSIGIGRDSIINTIAGSTALSGTTTAANYKLAINGTLQSATTTTQYGFQNQVSFNPTGGSISTGIYALNNIATMSGTALTIPQLIGIHTRIDTAAGFTGTVTNGYGLSIGSPSLAGGKIDNYYGIGIGDVSANGGNTTGTRNNSQIYINSNTAAAGSGGIINNYGIKLYQPAGAGAGTTNNYGFYLTGNGGGTVNYAIYNDSTAANYIQGDTSIGTSSNPSNYKLNVSGSANVAGGIINLNASSNFAVNIGTGSTTATVSIGNSANTTLLGSSTINIGTATAVKTIQGTAQTTSNTAGTQLTIKGSAGNGTGNGGTLLISGGDAGGSGGSVMGLVSLNPAAFNSIAVQTLGTSQTLTQSWVDSYSTLPLIASASSLTFTVPVPTVSTLGRVFYLSNAGATNDFSIILSGTSITLSLKPNSTATLIWNGNGWTAAGASSSTDLQSAYNNTLTSAGTAELVLNASGGAADGLTIRNNGTSPITGGILEVQSSIGTNLFSVNNRGTELAANGGAETQGASSTTFPASTWEAAGATTVTRTITSGEYMTGQGGVKVVTGNSTMGVLNNLTASPAVSTTYQVSFTAKSTSATAYEVIYSPTGGTNPKTCTAYSEAQISSTVWTKVTCTITTDATVVTNPDLTINKTTNGIMTVYIDNLSFMRNDSTTQPSNVQIGGGITGGQVTLFTLDRSSAPPVANGDTTYYGSMYYDTSSGRIQCYEADGWGACGSAPDNIVVLTPEYSNAVLNGTGVGTMTADFCANKSGTLVVGTLCASGVARNFYRWTSPQSTNQTYSVYVSYKLPSTFKEFYDNTTIKLTGYRDSTNASMDLSVFRSTGSDIIECGSKTAILSTTSTWQTTTHTSSEQTDKTNCNFQAGEYVIYKIDVTAKSNANVYIENLEFRYTNS